MIHIKIDNKELEEKIKKLCDEENLKYTELLEKLINRKVEITSIKTPTIPISQFYLDLFQVHFEDCSIKTEQPPEYLKKQYELAWKACLRLGLIEVNPLITSFRNFQYIIEQTLYHYCFIGKLNEDAFTQNHLFKLHRIMMKLEEEERNAIKQVIENRLVSYIGFDKAERVFSIVFNDSVEMNEKQMNEAWKKLFGDSVKFNLDEEENN